MWSHGDKVAAGIVTAATKVRFECFHSDSFTVFPLYFRCSMGSDLPSASAMLHTTTINSGFRENRFL